jgi:hypothetical protein
MSKKFIISTAASLFAAGTFTASAQTPSSPTVPGIVQGKDCRASRASRQSACKSANACKGQNACKGKGWVSVGTAIECSVLQQNPPKGRSGADLTAGATRRAPRAIGGARFFWSFDRPGPASGEKRHPTPSRLNIMNY